MLKLGIGAKSQAAYEPATFGWLCVETAQSAFSRPSAKPATFGWLCVETLKDFAFIGGAGSSHLRVAVC